MKKITRVATVALALLLVLLSTVSCANQGKALITLNKNGYKVSFSANLYQLLLSRWKGQLVNGKHTNNGYNAEQDGFYDSKDKYNGESLQTLGEFYADLVLENCKNFTAVLWLFESMNLSISDAQTADIDERLNDLLEYYGGGSKTKLNSILANYGVNYSILREAYLMEAKVDAVQAALYGAEGSLLGQEVKTEFLSENYVHFKQIFLPYFHYVYETDANGDEIYYVKESQMATVCYDTTKFEGKDENGAPITDKNGDTVFYTSEDQTRIAYDKVNGVRSFKLDSNGESVTKEMTVEEIAAVKKKGTELFASLQGCTVAQFEEAIAAENIDFGGDTYTDGYYLQKTLNYSSAGSEFTYFTDIVNAMDAMENGEIAEITSDSLGYHIVIKLAPSEKAYEMDVNQVWFKNFNSALVESLFLEECRSLYGEMTVDFEILATISDIKAIGVNLYY